MKKTAHNDNVLRNNFCLPFTLEKSGVRGRFIRLGRSVHRILSGHNYPEAISELLGEMLIISAMISSTLKGKALVTVQAKGDGPLQFIVADCTTSGNMRGYAQIDSKRKKEHQSILDGGTTTLSKLLGTGFLVISVENMDNNERYQGTVELKGESLADCVTEYFEQSVQRDTALIIAVEKHKRQRGYWGAGGIMLQRTPLYGGHDAPKVVPDDDAIATHDEDWNRSTVLMQSAKNEELIQTKPSASKLLYNLFHEEGVRIYPAQKLQAKCRCSREKIENILQTFPKEEIEALKDKNGQVKVQCQFCGKEEVFGEY